MRILAIESALRSWQIALLRDLTTVYESSSGGQPVSQGLVWEIERGLRAAGWIAAELDLIVVDRGPGSFTGLRGGVTVAKTLAYATGSALVGGNSLETCAAEVADQQGWPIGRTYVAVMDALRGELVFARYVIQAPWRLQPVEATRVGPVASMIDWLTADDWIVGPAVPSLKSRLDETRGSSPQWIAAVPRADVLGRLGLEAYREGERTEPLECVPVYFRPSYADEPKPAD
jgi:tRNA threonylcarbamoyladenosine biosynthesis protein TsaB